MGIRDKDYSKLRVLLVQHELFNWFSACSWSYSWHLGIEEGLKANGVEFFTLTSPWLFCAHKILKGMKFDQIWINDIAHLCERGDVAESEIEWLASLSPVRIGFCIESIEYPPEVYKVFPGLKTRQSKIELMLKYVTHAIVCDEKDEIYINTRFKIPVIWAPLASVPERYISKHIQVLSGKVAIFSGKLYGERKNWLEMPELKKILTYQASSEKYTLYPFFFNRLHDSLFRFLSGSIPTIFMVYPIYLKLLRRIRRQSFILWLRGMQGGAAVVNLPSFGRAYTSRVFEGMAAGCPVISWEIPDRPRTKALFKDGEDILLYRGDEPMQLADHIQHILSDPEFGRWIAYNGQLKIRNFHTNEKRVKQILDWIETGKVPRYI